MAYFKSNIPESRKYKFYNKNYKCFSFVLDKYF